MPQVGQQQHSILPDKGVVRAVSAEIASLPGLDTIEPPLADLGQQASVIEAVPLLDNTRITFSVDNIFDARQRVTDNTGTVPLSYQPFLIDPHKPRARIQAMLPQAR